LSKYADKTLITDNYAGTHGTPPSSSEANMRFPILDHRFLGFFPPYRTLEVLEHPKQIPDGPLPSRGFALLWNLGEGDFVSGLRAIRERPPGLALVILLPAAARVQSQERLLDLIEQSRPHSILPFMEEVETEELTVVLRRFPAEFALEVTDYLTWRGVEVDMETRRLLRKTLDLSDHLSTVNGLARALYMSRRALGRRFMTRGLPVPSHFLHFGRVLRASVLLQVPDASLFGVSCELGYPDGFALSNQMKRLTGLRPSIMKECFGWEWIVESWLHLEAVGGNLSPNIRNKLFPELRNGVKQGTGATATNRRAVSVVAMNVAEDVSKPNRVRTTLKSS
jgi:AraC-like DNA-binding protein